MASTHRPEEYFSNGSKEYARFRPGYPENLFDWIAEQCDTRDVAWDCACGSGQATMGLSKRFRRVIATDANANQLASAPKLENVEWRLAKSESCGIDTGIMDCITIAQALHWMDLPKFWSECERVLKPNGIMAAWGYGIPELDNAGMNQVFQRYYSGVLKDSWTKERRMVEEGYSGVEFPFEEIHAPGFEIKRTWNVGEIAGYCASWSATEIFRRTTRSDPIPQLSMELEKEGRGATCFVKWPVFMRVGKFVPRGTKSWTQ